jgi:aldehyde dehydrogenase (NAD+)
VTLETGKIVSEGLGEVQEMIDICDFAVGLSRQLYGRTIATERADHRMMETLGTRSVSAASYPLSTFPWRFGPEMPRLLSSAATRWSGSPPRRRR